MDDSDDAVTEIIPFNEFGALAELGFRHNAAFDTEAQVLAAPELDDLNDQDEPPPCRLVVLDEFRGQRHGRQHVDHRGGLRGAGDLTEVTDAPASRGRHRRHTAVPGGAVKARLVAAAMAAGAAAAAANTVVNTASTQSRPTVLAADEIALNAAVPSTDGVQLVSVAPAAADSAWHGEQLAHGAEFAQQRAQREARLQRPLYVFPTTGMLTSGFGYRWGTLHAGLDIANSIGTPIYAVSDGVVIASGPVAGYGLWVKLRHPDGTVTLYGHIDTTEVDVGQRVMAGDQIATVGNRGNSTGPHLHLEVLANGADRIDPAAWLAKRGVSIDAITS